MFLITATMATSGLYGRSIQDLRAKGSVRSIGYFQKRLNLSGQELSSLEGLGEIRRIEQVSVLRLDNNSLEEIGEGALAPLEGSLQVINLSNNLLTGEGLKGLAGLKNLRALILNSNNINDIPQEVLDGLPKLSFISIYDNPISVEKINKLRHQGYYVSTWPITRSNLKKAGLAALALTGLILAAVGLRSVDEDPKEIKEEPATEIKEKVAKTPPTRIKLDRSLSDAISRLPKDLQESFLTELAHNIKLLQDYPTMPKGLSDDDFEEFKNRVEEKIQNNDLLIDSLDGAKGRSGPQNSAIDKAIAELNKYNDTIRKIFSDVFIL